MMITNIICYKVKNEKVLNQATSLNKPHLVAYGQRLKFSGVFPNISAHLQVTLLSGEAS